MNRNRVDLELKSALAEDFSKVYPAINAGLMKVISNDIESRNGKTFEALNFKTELTNPLKRCVGTSKRDMNIFFLLAEAMWIWSGKKDVEFLDIFNSNMKQFSDDGVSFHAPYGFRLRHYGKDSFSENCSSCDDIDQFSKAIQMLGGILGDGKETRRVALSIWNPKLDLGRESKDLPCNDMLFLQQRAGKLHATIANRSNDLHWGLPTNIFQFSFILESLSLLLGLEIGTQTHNSKSLHIYKDNPIAQKMIENYGHEDLYDFTNPALIDFSFDPILSAVGRLEIYDDFIGNVLGLLSKLNKGTVNYSSFKELCNSSLGASEYLRNVALLLGVYVEYKNSTMAPPDALDNERISSIDTINDLNIPLDLLVMANNFFYNRIKNKDLKAEAKKHFSIKMTPEQQSLIGNM